MHFLLGKKKRKMERFEFWNPLLEYSIPATAAAAPALLVTTNPDGNISETVSK